MPIHSTLCVHCGGIASLTGPSLVWLTGVYILYSKLYWEINNEGGNCCRMKEISWIFLFIYTTIHSILAYKNIISGAYSGLHERMLLEDLLAYYNKLERPVANESEAVVLTFGLTLQQIIDVVCRPLCNGTKIFFKYFFLQDEKNQILTTNVWLNLVRSNSHREMRLFIGPWFLYVWLSDFLLENIYCWNYVHLTKRVKLTAKRKNLEIHICI